MSRVLVVDDEAQNRYLLEVLFRGEGCEVELASNGREALAVARLRRPDLIVSDILMPEMDGFVLCREVKADPFLKGVPFVFYTATYTEEEDERFAREVGGDLFIRKPAEPDEFLAEIRGLPGSVAALPREGGERERVDEVEFLSRHDRALARKLDKKHQELLESEARYRSYFRGCPVAILVCDEDGSVVDLNPAASVLSGYAAADLLGANLSLLLGGRGADAPLRLDAGTPSAPARPSDWRLRRKDGDIRDVTVSPIPLDGGRVLAFCEDVTERVKAREAVERANAELEKRVLQRTRELEHANQEIEAFTYSVSNDLRAPLRAIDGFSQLLAEKHGDRLDDEGRQLLEGTRRNARRMAELLSSLAALSKVGRRVLQVGPIDMTALAESVVADLLLPEERDRTTVVVKPLPVAEGDAGLVRQVFACLLGNALKFSSKQPRRTIEVGAEQVEGETAFYVRDDGAGFDPTQARRLFTIFERLHDSREYEGTGVGLALVRRIVERHGGRVSATGSPGAGATFRFTLGALPD